MKFQPPNIQFCARAIIVILMAWLYSIVVTLPKPTGPRGELIPSSKPDEKNRVFHPQGFSIIAPENWDRLPYGETGTPAYLQIAARGTPGHRLKSMITVTLVGELFDTSVVRNYKPSMFQDQFAWEYCRITKEYTFDDGARSECDLFFKRGRNYWHIHFLLADEMTSLPNSVRQFLETFRLPSGGTAANNEMHSEPPPTPPNNSNSNSAAE